MKEPIAYEELKAEIYRHYGGTLRAKFLQALDEAQQAQQRIAIERDKEFWRKYADETCRNLQESNAALQAQLAEQEKEIDLERQMVAAIKHSVVDTVGGVDYEGCPTSEINYLQRLRILVEKEAALQKAEALVDAEIKWLKNAPADYASLRGRAIILERARDKENRRKV